MANSFYFPNGLLEKLERISRTPVTVVVAPAGYGKTTIVAQKVAESGLRAFWIDCEELIARRCYDDMCGEFEKICPAFAKELAEHGVPRPENALEIMNLIHIHEKTIEECLVVFENFQILQALLPANLLTAILHHQGQSLNLVFLTSHLWEGLIYDPGAALLINTEDFTMEPTEIMRYFRAEKIEITTEEAERIFEMTGGWNLAVYSLLQKCIYSTADLSENEIQTYLNKLILNRYGSELIDAMLRLNPFVRFTDETVGFVLDDPAMFSHILIKLKSTPLITYSPITHEYYPHPTVSRCFRSMLDSISAAQRRNIFRRAGDYYGSLGKTADQLRCYGESEDNELILRMDHVALYNHLEGDESYARLIESILKQCTPGILFKYPHSLLCFARQLFAVGNIDTGRLLVEQLRLRVEQSGDSHLLGEIALVSALGEFPHICGMRESFEAAAGLLDGPSAISQPGGSFLYGYLSMISLFYLVPGSADKMAEEFEEAFKLFTGISQGLGAGADLLFRGELALMRCQFDDALICAYKAEAAAGTFGQPAVLAGAALLKGYVSVARKDQRTLNDSLNYLIKVLKSAEEKSISACFRQRVKTSLNLLLHLAGRPGLGPVEDPTASLTFPQDGVLLVAFLSRLFEEKQYARLISIVESLAEPLKQAGVIQWIDSQLLLALSYAELGKIETGTRLVEETFKIAEKDQILYPFSVRASAFSQFFPERLIARISQGADRELWETMSQQKLANSLTDREREVALLAAGGLRNREIAERLYLSDGTVRNHLSTVYQKLNIDRRSKLSDFEQIFLEHDKTHDMPHDD